MTRPSPGALRATTEGLALTLSAPGLLLATLVITVITAVPFAFVIETPVMRSLAMQPAAPAISPSEIDAEWWQEFSRHTAGLAATFTPAVLGFAAPLDSVSALLDGTRPPLAMAVPIGLSMLVWAFLWGGVFNRFATGVTSAAAFVSAGSRYFARMSVITVIAALVSVGLYATLHTLLFAGIYDQVASRVAAERDAFAIRVILYAVFGSALVLANAVFSFARVFVVAEDKSATAAIARGWSEVRQRFASVAGIYVIYIAIFAILMIGYAALELMGGSRVGGWRAVVVGQAFVVVRLALRLALGGSQVRLSGMTGQ